ncbi:transposase [Atopobium sp. oral taxon 416]|nr:transposase [Atopobium sp. oral taxon 416]QUC03738.1 transposase [Atopobium sp. oral taxon 416]
MPFKTRVFDNYKRSEAALVTTMAKMVLGGASTAKVGKLMETICDRGLPNSTVAEACATLDGAVEEVPHAAHRGRLAVCHGGRDLPQGQGRPQDPPDGAHDRDGDDHGRDEGAHRV